jgi:hypothetical protein
MMTRASLKSSATILSVVIACAFAFAFTSAKASSFASAVTNNNGTIQFILNQTADFNGVKVVFDNGTVTNVLVGETNVGLQTFPLGAHTNFLIYVTTTGNGSPSQISVDSNTNSTYASPRGVASEYNPKIGYLFGRIFVGNSTAGATKGINLLNADESSASQGKGPWSSGLWASSTSSPYRMNVTDDGTLYVGDFSTAAATVWQFDPTFTKFTNQVLAIASETGGIAAGTHGDICGEPVAIGSVASGNLVLYTADPGLAAGSIPTNGSPVATLGYQTGSGTYNNVFRYTIGSKPLPYTNGPDLAIGLGLGSIAELTIDVAIHKPTGNIYGMFYRANAAAPCLQVFDPTGQIQLFTSLPPSLLNIGPDPLVNAYALSISPDGRYVAIMNVVNAIYVMNITNGVPDLSSLETIPNTPAVGNARGICWDAADNIYADSSGQGYLRIYSLGNTTTAITGNDATGTNGNFQLVLPPITASVVASAPQGSQNGIATGGTPYPATFTVTLNTNFLASPVVVNFVLGGTATNGTYISSATNTVTFPAGTSASGNWSTNINITPTAVPLTGPTFTVTCQLTGGAAYLTAAPTIATVSFINTGPEAFSITPIPLQSPPITSISGNTNSSLYRGTPGDFVPFQITRLGNTAQQLTITNFIYGGTAVFGTDYTAGVQSGITPVSGSGSVTFGPGDVTKQVIIGNPVPTPFGAPAVGDKTITVALGSGPSQEGAPYSVTGNPVAFVLLDNAYSNEVVLWSDPLTNKATSTNWTVTFATTNFASNTVLPVVISNYNASPGASSNNYATDLNGTSNFDVEFGYPVANDSVGQSLAMTAKGWTTALKMTVNKDPNYDAPAGVNAYPQGMKFFGNYALRFSMMLVEGTYGQSFSSEFATFGIDHYGTNCNWVGVFQGAVGSQYTNLDGSWAGVGSDQGAAPGGTPADLALYNGAKALPNSGYVETVSAVENTFSNIFRHPAPFTATGSTTNGIGSPANLGGQPANTWVDVEMKQYQGTATLSIDKSVVLSFANTNVFTNGDIMLGYDDPIFNQSDVGAVYYSNVRAVELAPFITNGPTGVVINPGGTATFSIGAVGTPPFTNQLYASNGFVAIGSPQIVATTNDSATFTVTGITATNSTNYYVVVSDISGSITSSVVPITVVTPPVSIITNEDVNVSITPGLVGPTTGLFYQWSTNSVNLTNNTHLSGATTATLTITNIQPTDAGTYTVVVSNIFGFTVTDSATLTVVIPTSPTFTGISYNHTNATLNFSSTDIYDSTNSFILQSSTVVTGPYTNTTATVTSSGPDVFQIILPQTNKTEFYILMHK